MSIEFRFRWRSRCVLLCIIHNIVCGIRIIAISPAEFICVCFCYIFRFVNVKIHCTFKKVYIYTVSKLALILSICKLLNSLVSYFFVSWFRVVLQRFSMVPDRDAVVNLAAVAVAGFVGAAAVQKLVRLGSEPSISEEQVVANIEKLLVEKARSKKEGIIPLIELAFRIDGDCGQQQLGYKSVSEFVVSKFKAGVSISSLSDCWGRFGMMSHRFQALYHENFPILSGIQLVHVYLRQTLEKCRQEKARYMHDKDKLLERFELEKFETSRLRESIQAQELALQEAKKHSQDLQKVVANKNEELLNLQRSKSDVLLQLQRSQSGRNLRIDDVPNAINTTPIWRFQDDRGGFENMTLEQSEQLSYDYKKWKQDGSSVSLERCKFSFANVEYAVNFTEMVQIRQDNKKSRKVSFYWPSKPKEWSTSDEKLMADFVAGSATTVRTVSLDMSPTLVFTDLMPKFTWHETTMPGGSCRTCQAGDLKIVERVENWNLWSQYTLARSMMKSRGIDKFSHPSANGLSKVEDEYGVDKSINESFLFHGCGQSVADQILADGFDPRLARKVGYYGEGTYFTNQLCKALRYAHESDGIKCIIVARVLLGNLHKADRVLQNENIRRAPNGNDSIYAAPGPMPGHNQGQQTHWEFISFDARHSYPSFLLKIRAKS